MKKAMAVCAALILGFALGAYFSHPPRVKASTLFHIQKVRTSPYGDTTTIINNDDYVGFACTAQDCYILTR